MGEKKLLDYFIFTKILGQSEGNPYQDDHLLLAVDKLDRAIKRSLVANTYKYRDSDNLLDMHHGISDSARNMTWEYNKRLYDHNNGDRGYYLYIDSVDIIFHDDSDYEHKLLFKEHEDLEYDEELNLLGRAENYITQTWKLTSNQSSLLSDHALYLFCFTINVIPKGKPLIIIKNISSI